MLFTSLYSYQQYFRIQVVYISQIVILIIDRPNFGPYCGLIYQSLTVNEVGHHFHWILSFLIYIYVLKGKTFQTIFPRFYGLFKIFLSLSHLVTYVCYKYTLSKRVQSSLLLCCISIIQKFMIQPKQYLIMQLDICLCLLK